MEQLELQLANMQSQKVIAIEGNAVQNRNFSYQLARFNSQIAELQLQITNFGTSNDTIMGGN